MIDREPKKSPQSPNLEKKAQVSKNKEIQWDELARLIAQGMKVKEAAEELGINPYTARSKIHGEGNKEGFLAAYGFGNLQRPGTPTISARRITEEPLAESKPPPQQEDPYGISIVKQKRADPLQHGMQQSVQRRSLPTVYAQERPTFIRAFVAQMLIHRRSLDEVVEWLRREKIVERRKSKALLQELESVRTAVEDAGTSFADWLRQGLSRDDTQQEAAREATRAIGFQITRAYHHGTPKKRSSEE